MINNIHLNNMYSMTNIKLIRNTLLDCVLIYNSSNIIGERWEEIEIPNGSGVHYTIESLKIEPYFITDYKVGFRAKND